MSPPADVRVSVVLPTYRRASLANTLAGLADLRSDLTFEVVVVDNDVERSAEETVRDQATLIRGEVRYVVEPRTGSAYARNRGIAEARAPVTALLDDDVRPAPDWLDVLIEPILADHADVVGGRVVLDPTVARPKWFDETGIGGYLTSFHLDDTARPLTEREYVVTANAAFRTELLRRTGGFDPALGPRGKVQIVGDDVHVVRQARRLGGRIWYAPDAVVVHELPASRLHRRWLLKRAWWQGRSDWILDEPTLRQRRYGGAAVAADWYRGQLRRRRAEGLTRSPVLFHALCDTARTAGSLVGAVRLSRAVSRVDADSADTVDDRNTNEVSGGDGR